MANPLSQWRLCAPYMRQLRLEGSCRNFGTFPSLQAGHNRWSKIKHDKGRDDAIKGRERASISKEIMLASKGSGPDPKSNPRLALAISNAKKINMPRTTVESAIARGQGKSTSGVALEPVTIEAMLPPSVAILVECLSDQKARTLQDLRIIIKDAGGTVTPTAYLFEKKGKVTFQPKDDLNVDDYLEPAIDAGAVDVDADDEGRLIVYTEPTETTVVGDKLVESTGLKIESSDIMWDPNKDTMVQITSENEDSIEEILTAIREETSVQDIYINSTVV
ncbi:hypothetical protein AJ80_04899 [Polytolypa hystricis UAMH7299]|uniref:Uncharacterized protein n=1 Tax=Polytolypa hystricis (strain UAMH7299) TaxID=1447883 RepID=A0A2B7Y9H3_POLH7|nr:hypothetical protein AJ80_04899 [Polytolypa hystricis UAMH7299]